MGKTYKHQIRYDYLHNNRELSKNVLYKLLKWFNRINFWDYGLKIKDRKYKDCVRGGSSRIKATKYK